jgi:hypothetical protein
MRHGFQNSTAHSGSVAAAAHNFFLFFSAALGSSRINQAVTCQTFSQPADDTGLLFVFFI